MIVHDECINAKDERGNDAGTKLRQIIYAVGRNGYANGFSWKGRSN